MTIETRRSETFDNQQNIYLYHFLFKFDHGVYLFNEKESSWNDSYDNLPRGRENS